MFDPKQLLDQFLGAGTADRITSSAGGMLAQADVAAREKAAQAGYGDTYDKARAVLRDNAGGFAGGAVAGALAGLLLGTRGGRALGGAAVKLGGLAALGGLAYKAMSDYQAGRPILGGVFGGGGGAAAPGAEVMLPAPQGSGFEAAAQDPLVLLRAMIAAAKADGVIDDKERSTIIDALERGKVSPEARGFIEAELANPATPEALAALATSPQQAAAIYAAARCAVDPDMASEREWLARLAAALRLEPQLVAHLDAAASQAASA